MWKWLGGCLVVVVILIVVGSLWMYQTMQSSLSADGSARVTVAASPSRVFASLADGDSILTWMSEGNTVTASRRGPLVPGDTLRIEMRSTPGMPSQRMRWQVKEVVPDRLLVFQLLTDGSQPIMAIRRDSLAVKGDSTMLVSTLVPGTGGKPDGVLGFGSDLMLSMLRMQSKLDLDRLKARLERR